MRPQSRNINAYASDEARWQAVKQRDTHADEAFIVADICTGRYCKPSAVTLLPLRQYVRFFDSPRLAEMAGFQPSISENSLEQPLPSAWFTIVEKICHLMQRSEEPPNLTALAQHCEISESHLHRVFKTITGLTPKAYYAGLRACRLREELVKPNQTVTMAIQQAGYSASSRFYETATDRLGMTAQHYRQGAQGVQIYFALGQCSLGAVLVAQSQKGVCAISLGDDPQLLIERLMQQFPQAELCGGDNNYEQLIAQVVGYIEEPRSRWQLPLDIQGTVFQERVWRALRDIPPGSTLSYSEVAEKLGAPKAVRAVAQACAANRIAIAIPCHRVIRQDGGISGYRWGVERKRALLAREQLDTD